MIVFQVTGTGCSPCSGAEDSIGESTGARDQQPAARDARWKPKR